LTDASTDAHTIIVTGDRYWTDYAFILGTLRDWHIGFGIALLVHGDCRGADRLCGQAAIQLQIPVLAYPADWEKMGLGAGPQRNRQMVHSHSDDCCVVLAFHDKIAASKGTADMVKVCVRMHKQVVLYSHSGVEFL
jgi:hypothetical protein